MRQKGPAEFPFDLIVAILVAGELAFSLASASIILYFQFRFRRLHGLNSLWPVRLLLVLLASLLPLLELLRLPLLPPLCAAHSLLSPSLAEPAFFSTLLFLLRASIHPRALSFLAAAATALATSLPFLLIHILFLSIPNPFFLRYHPRNPCHISLFSTVLLAVLAAVYIPLFISAIWSAVAIVINKRLRIRLYALSATIIAAFSVQIAARALAALWLSVSVVSRALELGSFVALLVAVVAGEAVLVVQPIVELIYIVGANEKRLRLCEV